jgi:hypothetical protein
MYGCAWYFGYSNVEATAMYSEVPKCKVKNDRLPSDNSIRQTGLRAAIDVEHSGRVNSSILQG